MVLGFGAGCWKISNTHRILQVLFLQSTITICDIKIGTFRKGYGDQRSAYETYACRSATRPGKDVCARHIRGCPQRDTS